jgi:methylthioribose-1-phosphate isomerase
MKVNGQNYRTIWMKDSSVFMIEQTLLPFQFEIFEAKNYLDTCRAIKIMTIRGAPALGAAAGFAMAQAFLEAQEKGFWEYIKKAKKDIEATRPTARNLFFATDRVYNSAKNSNNPKESAVAEAQQIADEGVEECKKIGEYGNKLIKDGFRIETHCNAGWLACVDWGSALAPIYVAHRSGKKVTVYVDETGPRNQGAFLTTWELKNEGVPYYLIPDNTGPSLMLQGKVEMMIVGADRIARNGDVANKIGTLQKAIAAKEFGVPFYVAAPKSTFDLNCESGAAIPIEERDEKEVLYKKGLAKDGKIEEILVTTPDSKAINFAFDVTPAKYITGIITEEGIIKADKTSIMKLFQKNY